MGICPSIKYKLSIKLRLCRIAKAAGKIISSRPQLIQKATEQAAHSYKHRIPVLTQIILRISLKIKSHEERRGLQAEINQQNLQAQAFTLITQITLSTCICTSPQAQFNNSHRSYTHAPFCISPPSITDF